MKTLFLAWQDQERTRRWFVVGRLDRTESGFRFQYLDQERMANRFGFQPLLDFQDVEKVYESERLFPIFENRLLSKSRPDYQDFLRRLAMEDRNIDPFDILARTGGLRATDRFEVFLKPEPDEAGRFHVVFFARGIRHLPRDTEGTIAGLSPGDKLGVKCDSENEHDPNALLVQSNGVQVGWIPRYLCPDVKRLKRECPDDLDIQVELVNPPPAPVQQRLLCSITSP